ncbi:hypothetical protein DSM3645_04028 [Blastopirellula marina DSM 3645]|uniref:Uncharacterized protein n=1 Tax=Blastopirellula marina DSM 3645 TaxID=314230 RepID=A3ZV49_9BACT|nr:hypothetical protein DSM3645_04028 [Blastopirellula marina DSM 3645]
MWAGLQGSPSMVTSPASIALRI